MSRPFACGVDGGGSKAALCCLDTEGREIATAVFGPLNINSGDREAVRQTLRDIAGFLLGLKEQGLETAGLTIATAGVSNPDTRDFIESGLRDAGFSAPFDLRGDQEAALRGAVGPAGAVIIAGTGAICFGRNAGGESARAGGFGYLLDDEGSGYALGRDLLRAVLRARDGRGPATVLEGLLLQRRGLAETADLIRFAYDPVLGKANIAGLAPLLLEALCQGDAAAQAIADKAADELAALGRTVLGRLGLENSELVLMGGVLDNFQNLRDGVSARLQAACPGLSIIRPRRSAAWGAADLARERYLM